MIESQRAIVASSVALDGHVLRRRGESAALSEQHAMARGTRILWYAAGLLVLRREDRALRVFDAVLALQFDRPGAVWDGTWPRAPEEAKPRDGAMVWRDYDPNWRQFIGCLLGVMLRDFAQTLGPTRCDDARAAIARAIRGEPPDQDRSGLQQHRVDAGMVALRVRRSCARRATGRRDRAAVSRRRRLSRIQFADVLRRRSVGIGVVAAIGIGVARRGRAATRSRVVARCRDVLSPRHAQPVRTLRPRVWNGHDAVCVAARLVDVVGGRRGHAGVSRRVPSIRPRARFLRGAADGIRAANGST